MTTADRVAAVLRECQWDRIPERALPMIADLVEYGQDCLVDEDGYFAHTKQYRRALAALAKALGVEEGR